MVTSLSQKILRFVRGHFNTAPFAFLSGLVVEGGLDCLSLLAQQRLVYDTKFFTDLISAPHDVPWKVWTLVDLSQASSNVIDRQLEPSVPMSPLLQHTFMKLSSLEPRVRQGYLSLCHLGYNLSCCWPLVPAPYDMPALYHPALPAELSQDPVMLYDLGIHNMTQVINPGAKLPHRGIFQEAGLEAHHGAEGGPGTLGVAPLSALCQAFSGLLCWYEGMAIHVQCTGLH